MKPERGAYILKNSLADSALRKKRTNTDTDNCS